jgi:hypothetical protein
MRRTIFVCAKHQSLVLIRIESLSEFIQAFFLGPNLLDLFALFFATLILWNADKILTFF